MLVDFYYGQSLRAAFLYIAEKDTRNQRNLELGTRITDFSQGLIFRSVVYCTCEKLSLSVSFFSIALDYLEKHSKNAVRNYSQITPNMNSI